VKERNRRPSFRATDGIGYSRARLLPVKTFGARAGAWRIDVELDRLSRLEGRTADVLHVDEDVLVVVSRDEPVTASVVEETALTVCYTVGRNG
jgi:hypothetical protein